jgi:type II secretory pathway predicted ATPase ExeA
MYHAHWGLTSSPFGQGSETARCGNGANGPFTEALARLQYLVEQRGRIGLVLGAPGTGKTRLLQTFIQASRRGGLAAAFVVGGGCDEHGLLAQLARAWQLPLPRNTNSINCWERITDRLIELRYEQTAAIIALDDIDCCRPETRAQIERLLHVADAQQAQLTVLLSSSSNSAASLGSHLGDQIELRVDLLPWTEDETAEHVARRLFECGSASPIFTDEAIIALHELSGGVPRKVEQIAQLALLAGAGQRLVEIDAATLVDAYQELGFAQTGEQLLERL